MICFRFEMVSVFGIIDGNRIILRFIIVKFGVWGLRKFFINFQRESQKRFGFKNVFGFLNSNIEIQEVIVYVFKILKENDFLFEILCLLGCVFLRKRKIWDVRNRRIIKDRGEGNFQGSGDRRFQDDSCIEGLEGSCLCQSRLVGFREDFFKKTKL